MKPATKKTLKWVSISVGVVFVLLAGLVGYQAYQMANAPLPKPLPQLASVELTSDQGEPVTLGAIDKQGAPTLLSFWASWCVPCIQEAKALGKLRAEYGPDALNIIYINIDSSDTPETIEGFYAKAGNPDLAFYRADMTSYQAISEQNIIALPRSYIFDAQGEARDVFTGYDAGAEQELRSALKAVMS